MCFEVIIKKSMSSISYRPHSLDGKDEDLRFIAFYLANSKFKLYCMSKFFHTYELQYMHCFLRAKNKLSRFVSNRARISGEFD